MAPRSLLGSWKLSALFKLVFIAAVFVQEGESLTLEVTVHVNGSTTLPDPSLLNAFLRKQSGSVNPARCYLTTLQMSAEDLVHQVLSRLIPLKLHVQFERYVVDPVYAGPQGASQEDCDNIVRVRERWTTVPEPDTSERTHQESFTVTVDPPSRRVCICELEEKLQDFSERVSTNQACPENVGGEMVPLCAAISSGLFLYRLISVFTHDMTVGFKLAPNRTLADLPRFITPPNPTISLWYTEIAHVGTGHVVRIGEFRGAATVWSSSGTDALGTQPEVAAVKEDLEWLLALICGRCPHTYDGILAGCHA
ncbi:hypothetical protein KFL_003620110 [Klebsormidium nitens]|uniref:Uncharacterized protein n=1 Tax=Klebsormidium nitens TaxID=105231 RepID=A0A1Y1I9G0_KLENI|nr:hypothetical protein KFL_003620110 [Klebsormidium nitens]|eukprot:GAQ87580.1 hypothetical protein KFL_003620110 [Klebsormidium nitens]